MKTRRGLLSTLGLGVAVGIAGCNTDSLGSPPDGDGTSTDSGTNISETPTSEEVAPTQNTDRSPAGTEPGTTPEETATMPQDPENPETFTEHYQEWIHGEDGEIMDEAQEQFNFNDIHTALEQGTTRVEKVEQAVGEAATQYQLLPDNYENSHRHIMSAVHQTLEQTDHDFDLYSNINLGGAASPFEFSEIMVEQENGEYTTLIGQLGGDANRERELDDPTQEGSNRDVQVYRPGEETNLHEGTLAGLKNIENTSVTHSQVYPQEINYLEGNMTDEEWGTWMDVFGYAVIGGGHPVDQPSDFRPNHNLVPESQEAMTVVYEALHGDGDMEDYKALSEAYLNSDLSDTDTWASAEWTGSDWNIHNAEGWEEEDGFSYFAS